MDKIIIIPARMQSVRFPGKVIFPINGIPMVVRTAKCAKQVDDCSHVAVATDNLEVEAVCKEWGISTLRTGEHSNGTERCAEAARMLALRDDDQVINLQADLPYIQPDLLHNMFKLTPHYIVTAAVEMKDGPLEDPNMVKVVMDRGQNALWFSRLPIPQGSAVWHNHIGAYGFENKYLQEYTKLPACDVEKSSSLEQLRILFYMSRRIKVLITKDDCISVNTPSDIEKLKIYWPEGQVNGHVI